MNQAVLNITKTYSCDVLVCGGGVSGFAAAVAAARSGADVILVESGGCLGGTATKGLVGPFMTCYDAKGETQIIRGLFAELAERLVREGGAIPPAACRGGDSYSGYRPTGHIGVMPFNAEVLKRVSEQMCVEAGVKLLYHTIVLGCETDGARITRVYAADPNRVIAIDANVFVDTTGTAALAACAGAETVRGSEDGPMQMASTFFVLDGVNKAVLDAHMAEHTEMRLRYFMDEIARAQQEGRYSCGTPKLRMFEASDGTWIVNMAQTDEPLNELDGEAVTQAEIAQRAQIAQLVTFLRETIPGLENIRLVATGSDIGIRESRRLVGKTVFTIDDIRACRQFEDRIAVCASSVDIHGKNGVSYAAHDLDNYTIPLSCLISNNIRNLLTAGKTLSADRYAFAAVRVMPPCIAMGEAAGITAAIAAKRGLDAADVPCGDVQAELRARGAYLN